MTMQDCRPGAGYRQASDLVGSAASGRIQHSRLARMIAAGASRHQVFHVTGPRRE
jgi:hypothetical protein